MKMRDRILIKNGLQQYTEVDAETWDHILDAQSYLMPPLTFRGRLLGLRHKSRPENAMPPYNMVYVRYFADGLALGATWVKADDDIYVVD
jgi:hypothetical protein